MKRKGPFQKPINSMCILDTKIILASGNKIDVYDHEFNYCYDINEHKDLITSLISLNNKYCNLASSSKDASINIYLISETNYNLIQHIQINNSIIYRIKQLSNSNIISCLKNKTLMLFSNIGNKFQFQLKLYDPDYIPINFLKYKKHLILFSCDTTNEIYDLYKGSFFNIKMINNKGKTIKSEFIWLYKDVSLLMYSNTMCLYENNKILIMISNTIVIVNIDSFEITTIKINGIGHTRCMYPLSNNIYYIGNNCGKAFKFHLDEIINIHNKTPKNNINIASISNLGRLKR